MKKVYTSDANRGRFMYQCAIAKKGIEDFSPPPSEAEKANFEKMYADMREEEAKAKREGRSLIWDIPFDVDYD